MVNAGRVACIFTPFAITIAALVCVVLVFLSGGIDRNQTLGDLYFLKLDLSDISISGSVNVLGTNIANSTAFNDALQAARQALNVKDYYTIYLRGYCGWNQDDKQYAECSSPKSNFYFDPIEVWGLDVNGNDQAIESVLPKSVRDGLQTYETVSKVMSIVYIATLAVTALTLLVGISSIFSRIGSLVTTFFAAASGVLFIASSVLATVLFSVLRGVLNKELEKESGVKSSLGRSGYIVTWLGTAFAVAGAFFWLFSVCCCSGRSPYNPGSKDARRTRAEKTPYTYERVGSPYLGPQNQQATPLNNLGEHEHGYHGYHAGPTSQRQTAYEPFRAQV